MFDVEQLLALPIRALERATKRILWELPNGKRFYIVGGRDRRPLPPGVAGFSPREMIEIINKDLSTEDFMKIIMIKERVGGGTVTAITPSEGGNGAPAV